MLPKEYNEEEKEALFRYVIYTPTVLKKSLYFKNVVDS